MYSRAARNFHTGIWLASVLLVLFRTGAVIVACRPGGFPFNLLWHFAEFCMLVGMLDAIWIAYFESQRAAESEHERSNVLARYHRLENAIIEFERAAPDETD